jgi:hypothetical protein
MSQTFGKTRWKRFAVVMVPTLAATAAVGVSIAQGALAASFAVSGASFQVHAGELDGTGFSQYGTVDTVVATKDGTQTHMPVAVSGFNSADITNLCQSVDVPMPWGDYTLRITAGDAGTKVHADNMFIDMTDLQAQTAVFKGINIGVAGGAISKGPVGDNLKSNPAFQGSFGQEADSAVLTNVQQTAWATSAGTFSLANMHLSLASGTAPCH